jgi:LmbE family N-acetylglucosaminyl deacetylase
MMAVSVDLGGRTNLNILCIGAHSDDIEIGCGGTIMRTLAEHACVAVHWVVLSANDQREDEARRSAERFLSGAASTDVAVGRFRDGFFPYIGADIKEFFEGLKNGPTPDLIFTHHHRDCHQDHRVVSELTWNTFRDHMILEYEIPKYDGGLETPNMFVPIDERTRHAKLAALMGVFATQRDKRWFSEATFDGLMRVRGVECASPTGYAEGFHARKSTFMPPTMRRAG